MLIILILLSITALSVMITNPRSPIHCWGGIFLFCAGAGGLAEFLFEKIILQPAPDHFDFHFIYLFAAIFSLLCHYLAPYALLIFSLNHSGLIPPDRLKIPSLLFLTPMVIMLTIFPPDIFITSKANEPNFRTILTLYETLFILVPNAILIYAFWKQRKGTLKQQRFLACLIICPSTIMWLVGSYISIFFKIHDLWKCNFLIASYVFIAFIGVVIRYGFLGVKVTFEPNYPGDGRKAVGLGTSLLNHTLKNEMAKMLICLHNIKYSVNQPDHAISDINTHIQVALNSISHFQEMSRRINLYTQEIVLHEEHYPLETIINRALDSVNFDIKAKRIHVKTIFSRTIIFWCDPTHLQEACVNLLKNAIEAMNAGGKLEVSLYQTTKKIFITIGDNGMGISKESLPFVREPFFTTNKHSNNFGLGLSYCDQVIHKHDGSMEIQSEPGTGTTVLIYFPVSRLKKHQYTCRGGEVAYEN